jgi:hypothetical protein
MKKYKFYIDTKVTMWTRSHREISANSEEEAIQYAKGIFKDDDGTGESLIEDLTDTMEFISIEDNGGCATEELYFVNGLAPSGSRMIEDNIPVSVVRDRKIEEILNEK